MTDHTFYKIPDFAGVLDRPVVHQSSANARSPSAAAIKFANAVKRATGNLPAEVKLVDSNDGKYFCYSVAYCPKQRQTRVQRTAYVNLIDERARQNAQSEKLVIMLPPRL